MLEPKHTQVEPPAALSGRLGCSWPAPAFHLESSRLLVPCTFPESGTRPAPAPVSAHLAKCSFCRPVPVWLPVSVSLCRRILLCSSLLFSSTVPAQRHTLTWTVCCWLLHDYLLCTLLTCRLSFLFSLLPLPVCSRSLFIPFHPSFTTTTFDIRSPRGSISIIFAISPVYRPSYRFD